MRPPVTWTSVCGLLSLLLSVVQPVASAQCPSDWTLYSEKNSCFKIFSTKKTFGHTAVFCRQLKGGPQNNTKGHLAHIFDKQTDDFLKQLLQESGLDAVWIGLEDRAKDGLYQWEDGKRLENGDYTGWVSGKNHQSDRKESGVTLTENGWKEVSNYDNYYRSDNIRAFLCQVPAGLPDVELTCPPTEDGLPADVTCTFKQAPWTNLTWIVGEKYERGTCYPDFRCQPESGFQINVDNSSGVVKSKFTILKADFERHARVTCSVQFKTGSLQQSASCDLPIYSKPDTPTCTHNFTDTGVHVSCEVNKVYPKADCQWGRSPHKIFSGTSSISKVTGSRYKKMRCNLWDKLSASGNYTYTVKAIPQVDGVTDVGSVTSVPTDVIVSVYPPPEAPEIYITRPDQTAEKIQDLSIPVRVTAGYTTTLTCLVKGGSPHVHETTINCGHQIRNVHTDNSHSRANTSRVAMTFNNAKAVDGNNCNCYAQHIAGYDKESRITFAVDVPARVDKFYLKDRYGNEKVTVPEGTTANLVCDTAGSPWANITLYKEGKPLKRSIGKTRSVAILYHPIHLSCEDSGQYQCHAENGLRPQNVTTQWKTLDVNVPCKPRLCDNMTMAEGFGSLGNDANISVCVITFSELDDIRLYRDRNWVDWDRYNTQFSYTKQPRGIVTITLKSVTQQDFNSPYKLYMKNADREYSYTDVKLSPQGPPQCPSSLKVGEVSSNYVTLWWRAGFDGGQEQTFFVLRHSGLNDSRELGRGQKVAASDVTPNSRQEVNVTGLRQKTDYFFSVTATNDFGSAQNCEIVNVSTIAAFGAEALSDSEDNTPTVIIVVVVIVIVIVIVVAVATVIFLRRRMRKNKREEPKPQPQKRDSDVVIVNNELYATSKEVAGAKGGSTAAHAGSEAGTYANHGARRVPDVVYTNTPRDPAKVKTDVPEENLYANSSQVTDKRGQSKPAVKSDPKNSGPKNSDPNNGRSVSKDGLVYVTVDINPVTSNPQMSRGTAQKDSKYDKVDYASLDFVSMSLKNAELQKEGGASGKD